MNFEQEIRTLARRAIMEEINNLGIKALLREQIVDAGFTHDEIRAMIREAIDSFCRSALNTNDVADMSEVPLIIVSIRPLTEKSLRLSASTAVGLATRLSKTHWLLPCVSRPRPDIACL